MKHPVLTIGVTGGIGSGKSAVTDFFAAKSIAIIDADLAARMVVEPGRPALAAIADHFGPGILTREGVLDRRQLRDIIFQDDGERRWLEALLHPLIGEHIIQELSLVESSYAILVSPLLIEAGQIELVDQLLVVDVPETLQIQRTMNRDQMSEEQTRRVIQSQASRKQRLAKADDIVDNSGTLEQLHHSLETLHQRYLALAAKA